MSGPDAAVEQPSPARSVELVNSEQHASDASSSDPSDGRRAQRPIARLGRGAPMGQMLALQRSVGNRAVVRAVANEVQRQPEMQCQPIVQRIPSGVQPRTKYKAADASQLFSKTFGTLKLTAPQLASFQDILDGRAAIKEIDEDPVWNSILSSDTPKKETMREERRKWNLLAVLPHISVPTQQVLTGDILLPGKEGKTKGELGFREQLYATVLTYPMKITVAPDVMEPALAMKWGPANWLMPNDGGTPAAANLQEDPA